MVKFMLFVALCFGVLAPAKEARCSRQISLVHLGFEDIPVPDLLFVTQAIDTRKDHVYRDIVVLDEPEFNRVAYFLKKFDAARFTDLSRKDDGSPGSYRLAVQDSCKQIRKNDCNPQRSNQLFRFILLNINAFSATNRKTVAENIKGRINKE